MPSMTDKLNPLTASWSMMSDTKNTGGSTTPISFSTHHKPLLTNKYFLTGWDGKKQPTASLKKLDDLTNASLACPALVALSCSDSDLIGVTLDTLAFLVQLKHDCDSLIQSMGNKVLTTLDVS
jgi:hypothetical protein